MNVGGPMSPQWLAWRATVDLDDYERRFAGADSHGEADLIEALARAIEPPRTVLDAGCGTGRVAVELARRGVTVVGCDLDDDLLDRARDKAPAITWVRADLATMRLGQRFGIVAMAGNVMLFCRDQDQAAVVRSCALHMQPDGLLVAGFSCDQRVSLDDYDRMCLDSGLGLVERWATWDRAPYDGGGYAVSVHAVRPAR